VSQKNKPPVNIMNIIEPNAVNGLLPPQKYLWELDRQASHEVLYTSIQEVLEAHLKNPSEFDPPRWIHTYLLSFDQMQSLVKAMHGKLFQDWAQSVCTRHNFQLLASGPLLGLGESEYAFYVELNWLPSSQQRDRISNTEFLIRPSTREEESRSKLDKSFTMIVSTSVVAQNVKIRDLGTNWKNLESFENWLENFELLHAKTFARRDTGYLLPESFDSVETWLLEDMPSPEKLDVGWTGTYRRVWFQDKYLQCLGRLENVLSEHGWKIQAKYYAGEAALHFSHKVIIHYVLDSTSGTFQVDMLVFMKKYRVQHGPPLKGRLFIKPHAMYVAYEPRMQEDGGTQKLMKTLQSRMQGDGGTQKLMKTLQSRMQGDGGTQKLMKTLQWIW